MKKERSKSEPDGYLISAEAQPDEYLIAAYLLGAEGMMEIFRQRAVAAGHSGVLPAQEKLQSLVNERYQQPIFDGTSIKKLAQRSFTEGAQAVVEAFADQGGLRDISVIRVMEKLRTNVGKASRRER
jgi:CTP:molybdopterin cytidylyltransferase MocA